MFDIERDILMVASKLQLNCSGLLSTRPDISSPRTAFVAYPGSGSTYIRWTFPLFDRIRYESLSDVGEIRVYFASKILTPCRMH